MSQFSFAPNIRQNDVIYQINNPITRRLTKMNVASNDSGTRIVCPIKFTFTHPF